MLFGAPIIAVIHNLKEDRWHPVFFLAYPHSADGELGRRYKSKSHHTVGFPTRAEAVADVEADLGPKVAKNYGEPRLCLERDFPWDGEDVPAMVVFFGDRDGKAVPVLG